MHTTLTPDVLRRQVLACAARISGDPCQIRASLLGGDFFRFVLESTDASGGEYLRFADGATEVECLRGLLGVMAADDADAEDEADFIRSCRAAYAEAVSR